MKIGNFKIHRKVQWDLNDMKPLFCIHKTYAGGCGSMRILCLGFSKWKPVIVFNNPFHYRF